MHSRICHPFIWLFRLSYFGRKSRKRASGYCPVIGQNFKSDYTSGLRFSVYFEHTYTTNKVYFQNFICYHFQVYYPRRSQSLLNREGLYNISMTAVDRLVNWESIVKSKYTLFIVMYVHNIQIHANIIKINRKKIYRSFGGKKLGAGLEKQLSCPKVSKSFHTFSEILQS